MFKKLWRKIFPKKEVREILYWETADGRVIDIDKMDYKHMKSTVAWMERAAGRMLERGDLNGANLHYDKRYLRMKERIKDIRRTKRLSK